MQLIFCLSCLYYLHLHGSAIWIYMKTWCFLQLLVFLSSDVPFFSGLVSYLNLWWVSCPPRTSLCSNSWAHWCWLPGILLWGLFPRGMLRRSLLSPSPPKPEPQSGAVGLWLHCQRTIQPNISRALQISTNSCFRDDNIKQEIKITGIL